VKRLKKVLKYANTPEEIEQTGINKIKFGIRIEKPKPESRSKKTNLRFLDNLNLNKLDEVRNTVYYNNN
jgi:hypothetical protein